ncbi:MAG: hypothetical protein DCC75_10510 [Proteobacteria bacterium]|nr:MAG: hypothetical protein DCC75_10510 [Pseudomonadota bacterium]
MRIVSLSPFITETVCSLGLNQALVGISHACNYPHETLSALPHLTNLRGPSSGPSALAEKLCSHHLDLEALAKLAPDKVLIERHFEEASEQHKFNAQISAELSAWMGKEAAVHSYSPLRLEEVFSFFEILGKDLKSEKRGHEIAQRMKAQFLDWGDSFYERLRAKKVTFITGIDPLRLGGFWIPDMIGFVSCSSQNKECGLSHPETSWEEIQRFKPDVILVAPQGLELKEALASFKWFEKLPGWDDTLAVRRGEVFFTAGTECFYRAAPRLTQGMAILVSAMSGLESGYITPRDSFQRLRWLEIHRHRF